MSILAKNEAQTPLLTRPCGRGFLEACGERMALLGDEAGRFEVWMWPILLLRDLGVKVHRSGEDAPLPAAKVAREVEVGPGGFTLRWSGRGVELALEAFACRAERGVVLLLWNDGKTPLEVDLALRPVFRAMWPAGLGGQIAARDEETGALVLSEELGRFAALVGCPDVPLAVAPGERGSSEDPLRWRIPVPARGDEPRAFVIAGAEVQPPPLSPAARRGRAGATSGHARAEPAIAAARAAFGALAGDWSAQLAELRSYWTARLERCARLACPDPAFEEAFLWAQIAIERAWARVDGLGRGLLAGLGPSRGDERPGYGWFFGGDALSASRALAGCGDFEGARAALRFVAGTQREDGKLMHELTLAAGLCHWVEDYPYAYYKGQVTPGFVACLDLYMRLSGDAALLAELWPAAERALAWCLETLGDAGHLDVREAGIAAVEAGPLAARIASEVYLDGILLSALEGGARLARASRAGELAERCARAFERCHAAFEEYWSDERGAYGFARLAGGERCDDLTAYVAHPLSRGFGDPERARATTARLGGPELCADWGARMFSVCSESYDPRHYNTGAVFPYLTGFVVLAQYRHGPLPAAHQLLRSQVALSGFGGLGFLPEHLEGELAQMPARSVPHQVFSSSALLQGTLFGLLGLAPPAENEEQGEHLELAPALPPDWDRMALENLTFRGTRFDVELTRERGAGRTRRSARIRVRSGGRLPLRYVPRVPGLSLVRSATVGARSVDVACERGPMGAFAIHFPEVHVEDELTLTLEVAEGPAVALPTPLIERGAPSRTARLVRSTIDGKGLTLGLLGPAGETARLGFTCDLEVTLEGARFDKDALEVRFPEESRDAVAGFTAAEVRLRLVGAP